MGPRIIAVIVLVLVLGAHGRGQGSAFLVRHHLTLFGGVSVPSGDFGSTSRRNANAGFALFGLTGGGEYLVTPMRHVELGAAATATYHSRDEAAMTNAATYAGLNAAVLTGWWRVVTVAGSVGVASATSPTMELYARGYGGIAMAKQPEVQYLSGDDWEVQEAASANAPAFGGAVGARMSGLDVSLRFMTTRPEFHLNRLTSKGERSSSTDKRSIDLYAITVGLRIF